MLTTLKQLIQDESGATAIEYGLIAALISVAAVGAFTIVGGDLGNTFNFIGNKLSTAASQGSGSGSGG
ncbi:MAG TPA: Flp family type IVb pilin [Alphaproteobacteria bacterium]|nr:Flp family type IVb pilin [Alphaproteobacteria bacterium]